jgi:hypothetical protein
VNYIESILSRAGGPGAVSLSTAKFELGNPNRNLLTVASLSTSLERVKLLKNKVARLGLTALWHPAEISARDVASS